MAEADVATRKRCTKCGIEKPATAEFFQLHKLCVGGITGRCRDCGRAYLKAHRAGTLDGIPFNGTADGKRICNQCGVAKEAIVGNFNRTARGRCGLTSTCRDCLLMQNRQYLGRDLSPFAYGNVREGKKKCSGCGIVKTLDGFPKSNSQKHGIEGHCRVCKLARGHNRRVLVRSRPDHYNASDVERLKKLQRNRCWWCSKPLKKYHIDHRIPLARGGGNGADNIVLSCPTCNLRKATKMPWEMEVPRLL